MEAPDFLDAIRARDLTVAVWGLGYVGLPLCWRLSEAGFRVVGIDKCLIQIKRIKACTAEELSPSHLRTLLDDRSFQVGTIKDAERLGLAAVNAHIVCVPTPVDDAGVPELTALRDVAAQIALRAQPGQLIINESTVYPGATQEIFGEAFNHTSSDVDPALHTYLHDIYLAYAPERENPGSGFDARRCPKIVAGLTDESAALVKAFYATMHDDVQGASSIPIAEATKLTENVFRAVNIALVNELKMQFQSLPNLIDIWEVLDLAESKPYGFMRFNPGPGMGGHCIPVDPLYLTHVLAKHGRRSEFINAAIATNNAAPRWIAQQIVATMHRKGQQLRAGLLLGAAYKPNVSDTRHSPAYALADALDVYGIETEIYDPLAFPGQRALLLDMFDFVVLVTDHDAFDYAEILQEAKHVFDLRGKYRFERTTKVTQL